MVQAHTSTGKKRLTGFILLILMAAIAAPFVMRSPEEVRVALDLEIPPAPPAPRFENAAPVSEEDLSMVEQRIADLSSVPDEEPATAEPGLDVGELVAPATAVVSTPSAETPTTPQTSATLALAEGWTIQLASFSEADNALALVARLRDAGYEAYSRANASQTLYRVYAGPELERIQAVRLRERLAADPRIALDGLLVAYTL